MQVVYDRSLGRVELVPENQSETSALDQQFGPWVSEVDDSGLRGPAEGDMELMLCRRERDGAVLIEIERMPEGE